MPDNPLTAGLAAFTIMKNALLHSAGKCRLKKCQQVYSEKSGKLLTFTFSQSEGIEEVNKKTKRTILTIFFKN